MLKSHGLSHQKSAKSKVFKEIWEISCEKGRNSEKNQINLIPQKAGFEWMYYIKIGRKNDRKCVCFVRCSSAE